MAYPTRRTLLTGMAAATAAGLARPNVARAADAKTLTIWWNQGFYPAEDQAFRALITAWEKQSGVKVQLSLFNNAAVAEKIVAALTTGQVPDLCYSIDASPQTVPHAAWDGKLVDVSDVVASQRHEFTDTALRSAQFYNKAEGKRSFYGVPFQGAALNIPVWKSLVEKAGYQMHDIPKTWDDCFAFFGPVQKKLRVKGMRHVYGLGYTLSTVGTDPNNLFGQFLAAYGGGGIVTPDGRPHLDDAKVHTAVATALERLTTPYKQGYVPPGAASWNDPDNNNAFHSQEVVMTPNGSTSVTSAMQDNKRAYYDETATLALPLGNDGKPVPVLVGVLYAFVPKGAKNVDGAKDFLRYLIQPDHLNGYLKGARGRWLPMMRGIVEKDPYWLDPADPHRSVAIRQGVLGPTAVWPYVYNPGFAQVQAEEVWGLAEADVINGMKPEDTAGKALDRIKGILAKYQVS